MESPQRRGSAEAGGTGSWPCPPHGWQRSNRRRVSQPPRNKPWICSASIPYCEQLGVKRQPDSGPPRKCNGGEITR